MMDNLMASGRGGEAMARKIIESIDTRIYEPLRMENPHAFWAEMRDIHEAVEGCHYNKAFAEWEVSQMEHIDKSGVRHKGAHWSIEAVNNVYAKIRAKLQPITTLYDLYVALHSWWHDNIDQDTLDFGEEAESKNIERAVNYFFMDDDAPEGKIWLYYKGMHSKCE